MWFNVPSNLEKTTNLIFFLNCQNALIMLAYSSPATDIKSFSFERGFKYL